MTAARRRGVPSVVDDPVLSVVVMHHPARGSVADLVAACLPLDARVVEDPDPDGPPSPLRTAKLAWAAVAPGATHHLVLQDDVTPAPDLAAHLLGVLRHRPRHAVALYTNWNSPHNSYLVRSAAVAGQAWAPLGHDEWVPTLGLVLPADAARRLAAYLATFPDDYRDDDEAVLAFCAREGLPVVATVPHLLEHGAGPSLAGNEAHGPRHATVPPVATPADRWAAPGHDAFPARRPALAHGAAVELRDSRCTVRVLRPHAGEPLEHPFGWDWAHWSWWLGHDPADVVAGVAGITRPDDVAHLPAHVPAEVGAACWLLGADAARTDWLTPARTGTPARAGEPSDPRTLAVRTWVLSGVSAADLGPDPALSVDALVRVGLDALAAGERAATADGVPQSTGVGPQSVAGGQAVDPVTAAVDVLARGEAEVLCGPAHDGVPADVHVLPCPGCAVDPAQAAAVLAASCGAGGVVRYRAGSPPTTPPAGPSVAAPTSGRATVELLACERPPVRGFLALEPGRHHVTRAVWLAASHDDAPGRSQDPADAIVRLAAAESAQALAPGSGGTAATGGAVDESWSPRILPLQTGTSPFGQPHHDGANPGLARRYAAVRLARARELL
ncbi:hypothetical protein IF650_05340 [Cellulosimicrobium terreum]|nr:hypothetical protein [Cellulosimicrobium terreum]